MIRLAGRARERMDALAKEQDWENACLAKELAELERLLEKCRSEKFTNVDGFMAGNIWKDVYLQKRSELAGKAGDLEEQIKKTEERLKELEQGKNAEISEMLDVLEGFAGEAGLTAGLAEALMKKVTVYGKERFEIEWNFSEDVYQFIMEV